MFGEQRDRTHDLPRRTKAALKRIVLDERGLHRMQLAAGREAFDRPDRLALRARREREARDHALAAEMHCACSALTAVAAFLRTGQTQPLAQRIEQRRTRIDRERIPRAVDVEHDL